MLKAEIVKVHHGDGGSKANVFVVHLHGRIPEPSDPSYLGPVYEAHMLLTQEDGETGPAVMSLFGEKKLFPQIRKAWGAFVKDDGVTTSRRYGKIHPVDEWSIKWLTAAFVRWLGARPPVAAARGARQGKETPRRVGRPSRARPDRDRLEIPPGGGIRFASPSK